MSHKLTVSSRFGASEPVLSERKERNMKISDRRTFERLLFDNFMIIFETLGTFASC